MTDDNTKLREAAEALFLELCDLPEADRGQQLDAATEGNPELRRHVERMLAADARADDVLSNWSDRLNVQVSKLATAKEELEGSTCGNYTLLRHIDSGGMGDVWLAERSDGRFEGQFAVKLLRRHSPASVDSLRFEQEGRLLARLTHPNIARLIDAGTADERPFLVIEYIDGVDIDKYCDRHRLGVDARIRLFLDVLEGVAHAHANLVLHRDLKPGNILVTSDGRVKLLDFGIAKLLDEHDARNEKHAPSITQVFGQVLTPDYAAPEQLAAKPIGTATDIFALGMVLYVLLTGVNPRSEDASGDALKWAKKRMPRASHQLDRRHSITRRHLEGDLDNILDKALAPDAEDRYRSVAELRDDLSRYLEHLPVSARPPTLSYRTAKFLRRYRGGVALTFLFVLGLAIAAIVAVTQRLEAERQRDYAIYQQQRAETSSELLVRMLNDTAVNSPDTTVVEAFERSAATLDLQPPTNERFAARLYFDLSRGFESLDADDLEQEYGRRAEQAARASADDDVLAAVLCQRVRDFNEASASEAALVYQEAREAMARSNMLSPQTRTTCARADALMLANGGQREVAVQRLIATLDDLTTSPIRSHTAELRLINEIGAQLYRLGRLRDVMHYNTRLLGRLAETGRMATEGGIITQANQAALLGEFGELLMARQAMQAVVEMAGISPRRKDLLDMLAASHLRLGETDAAARIYEALLEETATLSPRKVARFKTGLARSYLLQGDVANVDALLDGAEAVFAESPTHHARYLTWLSRLRAEQAAAAGDIAAARRILDASLTEAGYPADKTYRYLATLLQSAPEMALLAGDAEYGLQLAEDLLEIALRRAREPADSADVGRAHMLAARALLALDRHDEAQNHLERAIESLSNGLGPEHPETRRAEELRR